MFDTFGNDIHFEIMGHVDNGSNNFNAVFLEH